MAIEFKTGAYPMDASTSVSLQINPVGAIPAWVASIFLKGGYYAQTKQNPLQVQ